MIFMYKTHFLTKNHDCILIIGIHPLKRNHAISIYPNEYKTLYIIKTI